MAKQKMHVNGPNKFASREWSINWYVKPTPFANTMRWPKFSKHDDFAIVVATDKFDLGFDEEEGLRFHGRGSKGVVAVLLYVRECFARLMGSAPEELYLSANLAMMGTSNDKAVAAAFFKDNSFRYDDNKFSWVR
jgi:hypothetical protein